MRALTGVLPLSDAEMTDPGLRPISEAQMRQFLDAVSRAGEVGGAGGGERPPSLKGHSIVSLSLRSATIAGGTFDNLHIEESDFSGATFRFCTFTNVNLEKPDLDKTHFANCTFIACTVKGPSTAAAARFTDCTFTSCKIEQLRTPEAVFESCAFDKCEITDMSFKPARWKSVVFKECTLNDCRFFNGEMAGVEFAESMLEFCAFEGFLGRGIAFNGGALKTSGFTNVTLMGIAFTKATLKSLKFNESDASDVAFIECPAIDSLGLIATTMKGVAFKDCPGVEDLTMMKSTIRDLVISGTLLGVGHWIDSDIAGATTFNKVVIESIDLTKSRLVGVVFESCRVDGTLNFESTIFSRVRLKSITYADEVKILDASATYLDSDRFKAPMSLQS